jgi:hypothetical protein
MRIRYAALVLVQFFQLSAIALPIENYQVEKASLSFQTWVRVEVAAKVVSADDVSIVGESSPFIQSLLYTSSKQHSFTGLFQTTEEISSIVRSSICMDRFDVDLKPNREAGALGTRVFKQKIHPIFVSLSGAHKIENKTTPFTVTVFCSKQ